MADATTTTKGKVELATDDELRFALGGTFPGSAVRENVITVINMYRRRADFTTPDASTTVAGKVELASQTEAAATSNWSATRVLSVLEGWRQIATWWNWVSSLGTAIKASKAQAEAGTDNDKAMTALRTKEAIAKQRAEWDGTATQYAAITTKDPNTTYYVHG